MEIYRRSVVKFIRHGSRRFRDPFWKDRLGQGIYESDRIQLEARFEPSLYHERSRCLCTCSCPHVQGRRPRLQDGSRRSACIPLRKERRRTPQGPSLIFEKCLQMKGPQLCCGSFLYCL